MCRDIHGDRYDYTLDTYLGMDKPFKVYCKNHGEFTLKPRDHIHQKHRCRICFLEESLEKSRKGLEDKVLLKHRDFYKLLSWLDDKGIRGKVSAVCKEHGEYETTAHKLQSEKSFGGCPKCKSFHQGGVFIEKAKKVHGNKYKYDQNTYVCSRTLFPIYCTKHQNTFNQRPSAHLQGQGCSICGDESRKENIRRDNEFFLSKLTQEQIDKYSYDKLEYKTSHDKVKIICPIHGEFSIYANAFFKGEGCQKCSQEQYLKNRSGKFFNKVSKLEKYSHLDFSNAIYLTNTTPMNIKCLIHNQIFTSTANKILDSGSNVGCEYCFKVSVGRWTIDSLLKIPNIHLEESYFYTGHIRGITGTKIGVTKNLTKRLHCYNEDLKTYDLEFKYLRSLKLKTLEANILEISLKKLYKKYNVKNDYNFGGCSEFYKNIDTNLLEDIFSGSLNDRLQSISEVATHNNHKSILNFVSYLKLKYKVE